MPPADSARLSLRSKLIELRRCSRNRSPEMFSSRASSRRSLCRRLRSASAEGRGSRLRFRGGLLLIRLGFCRHDLILLIFFFFFRDCLEPLEQALSAPWLPKCALFDAPGTRSTQGHRLSRSSGQVRSALRLLRCLLRSTPPGAGMFVDSIFLSRLARHHCLHDHGCAGCIAQPDGCDRLRAAGHRHRDWGRYAARRAARHPSDPAGSSSRPILRPALQSRSCSSSPRTWLHSRYRLIFWCDAIGLALFATVGAERAIAHRRRAARCRRHGRRHCLVRRHNPRCAQPAALDHLLA